MPCSCSAKAKAIQSRVHKQTVIVLALVINARPLAYRRRNRHRFSVFCVDLNGQYKIWTADADCGLLSADCGLQTLQPADCRLWTADYGLGIKHGLRYKTRTKHYGLNIKHGLRYKTPTAN